MLSDSSRLMDTENFIHDHLGRKKSPWRIVYTNKIIQAAGQQEERDSKLSSSSYCFLGRRKWTEEENLLIGKTATIGSDEESPAKKKKMYATGELGEDEKLESRKIALCATTPEKRKNRRQVGNEFPESWRERKKSHHFRWRESDFLSSCSSLSKKKRILDLFTPCFLFFFTRNNK